jgi:hypothetical protein
MLAAQWVSTPSWTNLNVKSETGVFQRYKREFDNAGKLITSSETQHNQAWVRTDRDNVTVTYTAGLQTPTDRCDSSRR